MLSSLKLQPLLEALERFPGLQRKEWELNQSGIDRGIEAVLIQRSPRELATYALARLRLRAMPGLLKADGVTRWNDSELRALQEWARTQGAGGSSLANLIEQQVGKDAEGEYLSAALATLEYYRRREAPNPIIKTTWTAEGLARLATIDENAFLDYPTRGSFWKRKLETVKRLVAHIQGAAFEGMSDEALLRSLCSISGVGEQTAEMVALFWLRRPVPVIDTYLLRLLRDHGLLLPSFSGGAGDREALHLHLTREACEIASRRAEWPAARVLSCLYLWVCETGRFHCRCATGGSASCPLRGKGYHDRNDPVD